MERSTDEKRYQTRLYRLRMIGGPYDNVEVTQTLEQAPRSYHWAGLPSEYRQFPYPYFNASDASVSPEPLESVVRLDYMLEAVYETYFGRIAIYTFSHPDVKRRFHCVEELAHA